MSNKIKDTIYRALWREYKALESLYWSLYDDQTLAFLFDNVAEFLSVSSQMDSVTREAEKLNQTAKSLGLRLF